MKNSYTLYFDDQGCKKKKKTFSAHFYYGLKSKIYFRKRWRTIMEKLG